MPKHPATPAWRYWSKVRFDGPLPLVRGVTGRCHVWTGSRNEAGYGTFWLNRTIKAHRHAVELADAAPIPAGLDVDHRCRNRACVRRSHLRAVTHRVNVLASTNHAAYRAAQTHCLRGHPFDAVNTYRARNNTRKCRTCKRAADRATRTTTPERTAA